MLTLLLLLWLRKVRVNGETNASFLRQKFSRIVRLSLPFLAFIPLITSGQTKTFSYQVLRNHNKIGTVSIVESMDSDRRTLFLESSIKARIVFTISVVTKEKTVFDAHRIVYAESSRKVTGNDDVYRKLRIVGDGYQLQTADKQVALKSPIFNNTVSLYTSEPVQSMTVFSDSFDELLSLKKTGDHEYVLQMPDGNRNTYRYKDGVCNEVVLDHKFFSARILLDKITQQ